jgi:hypothetical protein
MNKIFILQLKFDTELLVLFGPSWSFLVLLGSSWSFLVLLGSSWSFLVLLGTSWSFLVLLGNSWAFLVLLGPSRPFSVLLGLSWSFLVVLCPFWYLLLALIDSYWLIQKSRFLAEIHYSLEKIGIKGVFVTQFNIHFLSFIQHSVRSTFYVLKSTFGRIDTALYITEVIIGFHATF